MFIHPCVHKFVKFCSKGELKWNSTRNACTECKIDDKVNANQISSFSGPLVSVCKCLYLSMIFQSLSFSSRNHQCEIWCQDLSIKSFIAHLSRNGSTGRHYFNFQLLEIWTCGKNWQLETAWDVMPQNCSYQKQMYTPYWRTVKNNDQRV